MHFKGKKHRYKQMLDDKIMHMLLAWAWASQGNIMGNTKGWTCFFAFGWGEMQDNDEVYRIGVGNLQNGTWMVTAGILH